MRILITGAEGFIGKNVLLQFSEIKNIQCVSFTKNNHTEELHGLLKDIDWIFHLAGVNRPMSDDKFTANIQLTKFLCNAVKKLGRSIPIVFTSSIQVELNNSEYAISKRGAEEALLKFNKTTGSPIFIYRLPNVFGKFALPNYNSVVATFCYNIQRDLPININNSSTVIQLVYIDDLIKSFKVLLENQNNMQGYFVKPSPTYNVTVSDLANQLYRFKASRDNLLTEPVGKGLVRALYSTYISYLPPKNFSYNLKEYVDERGLFLEILKTKNSGQFSVFTIKTGAKRGGHYHHSKTEKFLIIKGKAQFSFRHIITGEIYQLNTSSELFQIVETIPG